jgi:hypothetical protein
VHGEGDSPVFLPRHRKTGTVPNVSKTGRRTGRSRFRLVGKGPKNCGGMREHTARTVLPGKEKERCRAHASARRRLKRTKRNSCAAASSRLGRGCSCYEQRKSFRLVREAVGRNRVRARGRVSIGLHGRAGTRWLSPKLPRLARLVLLSAASHGTALQTYAHVIPRLLLPSGRGVRIAQVRRHASGASSTPAGSRARCNGPAFGCGASWCAPSRTRDRGPANGAWRVVLPAESTRDAVLVRDAAGQEVPPAASLSHPANP